MTNKLIFKIYFEIIDKQLENFKKIVAEIVRNNNSFCGMFSTHEELGTFFYDYYFSEDSSKGSIILRYNNNKSAIFYLNNFVKGEYFERIKSLIKFEEFKIIGECSNELKIILKENKPKNISLNFRTFTKV